MEEQEAALQRLGERTLQENEQKTQSPDIKQETEGRGWKPRGAGFAGPGTFRKEYHGCWDRNGRDPTRLVSLMWMGDHQRLVSGTVDRAQSLATEQKRWWGQGSCSSLCFPFRIRLKHTKEQVNKQDCGERNLGPCLGLWMSGLARGHMYNKCHTRSNPISRAHFPTQILHTL